MKEYCGLVEQTFRGFDAFDNDAAGKGPQLGIFFRREVTPGEYHHGHVAQSWVGTHLAQNFEARNVRQPKVEYRAVAWLTPHRRQRFGAGSGSDDLDIVMAKQFDYPKLFGGVVLDDQQPLAAPLCVFFYA